jgi:hypothetical protein
LIFFWRHPQRLVVLPEVAGRADGNRADDRYEVDMADQIDRTEYYWGFLAPKVGWPLR